MTQSPKTYLAKAIIFVVGAALGIAGTLWWVSSNDVIPEHQHIHLPGYRFTNPLLECSLASTHIEDIKFRSFKNELKQVIAEHERAGDCEQVSLYFRKLESGDSFGIKSKELYVPASVLKIPVMIGWLKRAERDPAILKQSIRYDGENDLTVDQAFKPRETLRAGESYTVDDLIFRMIVYSDNNAWLLLVDNIDKGELTSIDKDLDLKFGPADRDGNTSTVREMSSYFRVLYNATYLNREMSEKALEYMSHNGFAEGIAAGVPKKTLIAGKFGERTMPDGVRQLHDFGIVYHPAGCYLLCIMTKGTDFKRLSAVISDISGLVYKKVSSRK